jgi:hypothetical protein
MRTHPLLPVVALAAVASLAACIRTVDLGTVEVAQDMRQDAVVRSAANLPATFTVAIPARSAGDCPPRLRDDALGATLDLERGLTLPVQDGSGTRYESFGDYRVTPRGHYGDTEPGDGLRIDCGRLRAVGVVTLGVPGGG